MCQPIVTTQLRTSNVKKSGKWRTPLKIGIEKRGVCLIEA